MTLTGNYGSRVICRGVGLIEVGVHSVLWVGGNNVQPIDALAEEQLCEVLSFNEIDGGTVHVPPIDHLLPSGRQ